MTREEAIKMLRGMKAENLNLANLYTKDKYEALDMAINALEQQPNDDCVSRQAVLEKINDWWGITSTSGEPTLCDCIRELPPAAPTVQAIPLDKVKQAREEIDDLDRYFDNDYFSSNSDAMFKCSDVLAILDKLIAESEVD